MNIENKIYNLNASHCMGSVSSTFFFVLNGPYTLTCWGVGFETDPNYFGKRSGVMIGGPGNGVVRFAGVHAAAM
jgi:hypothetical protein